MKRYLPIISLLALAFSFNAGAAEPESVATPIDTTTPVTT